MTIERNDSPRVYFIDEPGACLIYFFENGSWKIDSIDSEVPGGGKRIVKEFVKRIGSGQPVCVPTIIETQTTRKLYELGFLTQVAETGKPLDLIDPNIIQELKMARVLIGGGIVVERVHIELYETEFRKNLSEIDVWNDFTVSILGKTV